MTKKILVQVNSSFDLYLYSAVILDDRNRFEADLLIPKSFCNSLPEYIRSIYSEIFYFEHRIRNLLSIKSILETIKLKRWANLSSRKYHSILFGAYRNDITSILVKSFHRYSVLIAIKQGLDKPSSHYKRFVTLAELHDDIYYTLFGYSSFRRERLIQKNTCPNISDFFFMRIMWKKDPFNRKYNVFTLGINPKGSSDGTSYFLPNYKLVKNLVNNNVEKKGVLIIGERTPMTPSWSESQSLKLKQIFEYINNCSHEVIYLRPRKALTKNSFYNSLNPIFLDPNQLFDDQLIKLNPRLVVSVKSTASKVAAYYGYSSLLLYPMLGFNKTENDRLESLFGELSPVKKVYDINFFKHKLQSQQSSNENIESNTNTNSDFFFNQLLRKKYKS